MAALQLFPYQEAGVEFLLRRPAEMNRKPHRLLADEQGLGKTPQAIVAMVRLNAESGLVVCPASVKYNWARKMVEWGLCDAEDIFIVRTGNDVIPDNCRFIVVNYDLCIVPAIHRQLFNRRFRVAVLDECHRLKNMRAKRSTLVLGAQLGVVQRAFWKFLLSGTPVPNRPIEFYIVLRTLAPELIAPFTKWVDFGRQFCAGWECKGSRRCLGEIDRQTGKSWNFKGASNIDDLSQRIAPFMLRRELKDVYRQLPDMAEEVVYLDVDITSHPEVKAQLEDKRVVRTEAFNPEAELPQATVRRIIGESKVFQAVQYIEEQLEDREKVVVVAYHKNVIDRLDFSLTEYEPLVIAGGVNAEAKDKAVQDFINNPKHRVMILQVTAGGEAIDGLQHICDFMVIVELDWSEGGMRQIKSRLHRIGQKGTVSVVYLIAGGTLDEVMAAVLERKSSVINQLMKGKHAMTIEAKLDRIIELLEGQQGGGTTAPAEEKPAPKADKPKADKPKADKKPKGPTMDEVKAAAKKFVDEGKGTKADAKAVLKKLGADSLAELDESKYQDAIDAYESAEAGSDDDMDDI